MPPSLIAAAFCSVAGTAVCLESCPNETTVFQYNPLADTSKALCLYDIHPTSFLDLQDHISNGTCVSVVFDSAPRTSFCARASGAAAHARCSPQALRAQPARFDQRQPDDRRGACQGAGD